MPDISDLDIYRHANELLKQHGDDAPVIAAMRAVAPAEAGDVEGYAVWRLRVLRPLTRSGSSSHYVRQRMPFAVPDRASGAKRFSPVGDRLVGKTIPHYRHRSAALAASCRCPHGQDPPGDPEWPVAPINGKSGRPAAIDKRRPWRRQSVESH